PTRHGETFRSRQSPFCHPSPCHCERSEAIFSMLVLFIKGLTACLLTDRFSTTTKPSLVTLNGLVPTFSVGSGLVPTFSVGNGLVPTFSVGSRSVITRPLDRGNRSFVGIH